MGDTPTAPTQPPLTLGTAGHIDHGKTALINALTGYNTDRLPEERSRGISIELGYARLDLPSGRRVSVVDAPGHERFVRTMVAGATGIDLFLMVVAADDGVKVTRAVAKVGGGALPLLELEGPVVAVDPGGQGADTLAARLRAGEEPVVGRVQGGRLLLDPRTLTDEEAEAAGGRVGAVLRMPPDG